jgi:serine/threonine protein phosphatase PrpC
MTKTETRCCASVSWLKNSKSKKKPYEDRFRLLTNGISPVDAAQRGELFAVFDGIGGAEMGMSAAQAMADCLVDFYDKKKTVAADTQGLTDLLYSTNLVINDWGCMAGTDRPLGGCAGTIAWVREQRLTLFHAGDTSGILLRPECPPRVLTSLHEFDGAISRYFGLGKTLAIEVVSERLEPGDLILLVSDGVTKVFSTTEAAHLVMEIYDKTGHCGKASEALVTRSRTKGSDDDITAMLIEVDGCQLETYRSSIQKGIAV